jgi:peptide/nickel transport system ATP-binding protein
LSRVGIPDPALKIDQYPHQLSGGQRQRAMIAIAISSNPSLLVADEPTTALDVTVQAEILDLLMDLQRQNNMALLLITHDMGVVADVADRVQVMRQGRVVESAPTAALFSSPGHEYTRELLAAVPHLGRCAPRGEAPRNENRTDEPPLCFSNVVMQYPHTGKDGFKAVDSVSFEVLQGEVVGLVGESGSGKSTLGKLAIGLLKPTEGVAKVAGIDLATANRTQIRQARREVSMVFQDPASSLNPRATIGDSVTAPLRWNKLETNSSFLAVRAAELLDMVRIPAAWASRFPHELSGGQRQRIGVARALALKPRLMIADEPTSALDVSVQATVLALLQDLQAQLGFSCLFISHDLSVIEQLANRVVVLQRGRIVEEGTTNSVLRAPQAAYTRALIAAAPVPDPAEQAQRRLRRLATV